MAIKYGAVDSTVSLGIAFFVNAAILILAAAAFFYSATKHGEVATLTDAYDLLSPAVGQKAAKILFAIALLAAGQNSSITGTLAGQIVMEGFLHIRSAPSTHLCGTDMFRGSANACHLCPAINCTSHECSLPSCNSARSMACTSVCCTCHAGLPC